MNSLYYFTVNQYLIHISTVVMYNKLVWRSAQEDYHIQYRSRTGVQYMQCEPLLMKVLRWFFCLILMRWMLIAFNSTLNTVMVLLIQTDCMQLRGRETVEQFCDRGLGVQHLVIDAQPNGTNRIPFHRTPILATPEFSLINDILTMQSLSLHKTPEQLFQPRHR